MGRLGRRGSWQRHAARGRTAGLACTLIGLAVSIGAVSGGATPASAAAINCHEVKDASCAKVGPYPLPLSVPEFSRLATELQKDAKSAATLVLFALLNAAEAPRLAADLGILRLKAPDDATQGRFRRFVMTESILAARCAASFVAGAQAPDYRYQSNAVTFWTRDEHGKTGAGPDKTNRAVALCSSALGCVSLTLARDPDSGWLILSPAPLIEACKKLQK